MSTATANLPRPVPAAAPALEQPGVAGARPLRLAYLTTEYPKVSHTFIRREILELERRGHEVLRLAIRDGGGAMADEADAAEALRTVHCLRAPPRRFLAAVALAMLRRPRRWVRAMRMAARMSRVSERGLLRHLAYLAEAALLLRMVRRRRIEHLHVHFGTNAAAVARLMRCLGGPPYSMTVHGPDEFDAPRGLSLAEKMRDAAFTVAISDFGAGQLRRWAPHDLWSRIHIVRCTVGESFLEAVAPIAPAAATLVCIGRLSPQKGQLLLLDAMRRLIDDGINARLVLAGDGELRREIEQRIIELALHNRVEITGWIDEAMVRHHIVSARALVQPSFAEGLPVVIMEAMAMARPVVSTMVAGIPELVRHGENGWLVPAGSTAELGHALREVMHAPVDRLNAMGRAGRLRVRERHFTATEAAKLEALFRRALDGHAGGGDAGGRN
jgi:glycosyltransferase involved in cell wall biosynthesis